ncbi:S41 family peptidase [Sphingobacterium sp. BIGb0165]|uniref:S41 family peptidase n=1 Tax=Sphingobacterium sp. BIGb0165 TaxID=2940615 RepID=UPI00216A4240|nr:S41 family peptidase [Sphingobacterium sp. BIGb0165]MCS4229247.1 C-terminal processing protease CtpA/Prc [Sphingobacterium sp. BIGb0165]
MMQSCNKKDDEIPQIPVERKRISENLDTIFRLAQDVYLWNDQLPAIGHFNPQSFYKPGADEISMYKNEIFEITRFPKIAAKNEPYEYNPFNPTAPKYSSIISQISATNDSDTEYNLYNPFGLSIGIRDNVIRLIYVDPNSPSGKSGLKRGDQIVSINGLPVPSKQSFLTQWKKAIDLSFIKFEIINSNGTKREVRLNAAIYEPNPVVKNMILEQGNKKIGYIAYNSFTPLSNSEKYLSPVLFIFEQKGITELIVDLRYNQGGYQTTVNFLANLIAPFSVNGKVMYSEHYNTKMQQGEAEILKNYNLLDENNKPIYSNGSPLTLFDIDYSVQSNVSYFEKTDGLSAVKKVYFIVSSMTASASELLINILKPYCDIEIIGVSKENEQEVYTYGKPVGFFDIPVGQFDLYLSMYEIKNAQNIGGYYRGIKADSSVPDDIKNDFGSPSDPAIIFVLNKQNTKKGQVKLNQLSNKLNGISYFFNTDRLSGSIREVKDLKIK